MLSSVILLMTACSGLEDILPDDVPLNADANGGVFILCEGNFNSGNSTLSYYRPSTKTVENEVFARVNDRRLGDTGQSIVIYDNTAYIAVENSGIIWSMDIQNFKVKGQLTATGENTMINPRYVHRVSDTKAYATDLYSHYITIFNPTTMTYTGSIDVSEAANMGYCSTEQMVQWGNEVFVNCWSYSDKILVIDTTTDKVTDCITLPSLQPKSMKMDVNMNGKLWVITDGGYDTGADRFGEGTPHLFRIDARSRAIELDLVLENDDANVQVATNAAADTLYILNNDIYRMSMYDNALPKRPFITAPVDSDGKRHKLYGVSVNPYNGDIYVADAVDYKQSGTIYRYSSQGILLDQFRVGIIPNSFAFTDKSSQDIENDVSDEPSQELLQHMMVNKVYEYTPAPGHQVNGYTVVGDFIHDGATMDEACDEALAHLHNLWMVSLGGQGGYIIAGFDHDVLNTGGYDIAIKGNPYSYQNEPGIIWVSQDENGNGLPDDTWYELAGSEYGTDNETLNYAITYYKPTADAQDIEWTDNMGGSGIIPYMEQWNAHGSYWQDWVNAETDNEGRQYRTYYGSRLRDTHTYDEQTGYTNEPPFAWGYADNDGSDYFNNSDFNFTRGSLGYYKISNAVTASGEPARLSHINFIKIQTAQTGYSKNLGEISTEVYGIWSLTPWYNR